LPLSPSVYCFCADPATTATYTLSLHDALPILSQTHRGGAVHGYALGGGFELVLVCDLVVAAESARFGLPEARLGLLPGGGGTQRLPRLVGRVRANELLMSARRLHASEALEWGLVNRVVPDEALLDAARELAESLLTQAPLAVRMAKRLVHE